MKRIGIISSVLLCILGMVYAAEPEKKAGPVSFIPFFKEEKLHVKMDFSEYPRENPKLKAVIRLKPQHVDTDGDAFALSEITVDQFINKKAETFVSFKDFFPAKYRVCVDVFDRDELIGSLEETFEVPEKSASPKK